jgi:tripeptidyl-peptidase I
MAQKVKMESRSILPIRIALAQQNLQEAEQLLMSVSDPNSPQYSKYWTAGAVAQKFSPSKTAVNQVTNWLNRSGIAHTRVSRSNSGAELLFDATVHEVEQLLRTTYYVYKSKDGTHGGCEEYSVPAEISRHIDFISTSRP